MAKKTRTELSTLAINTNLPDNTQELITPTTERSQLTDERESVVNYKDDLGGAPNAGKFLTVATDGESLTMVDAPTGDVTGTGEAFKIAFWFDTKVITFDTALFFNTNNNRLTAAQFEATLKVISAAYEAAVGSSMTFATGETGDPSPTTRLTISSGGLATFSNGIKFGGTPSPPYDIGADTLDAYEEGGWTPSVYYGSGSAVNVSTYFAAYTRIGNLVRIQVSLNYVASTGSGSGTLTIEGFPYNVGAGSSFGDIQGTMRFQGINVGSGYQLLGVPTQGTNKFVVQIMDSAGGYSGAVTESSTTNGWYLYGFECTYMI